MKNENREPVVTVSQKFLKILKGQRDEIDKRLEELKKIDCKIKMLNEIQICKE